VVSERLEIRLDKERQFKLRELTVEQQIAASELLRRLIDEAYEERQRRLRREALERLLAADGIEDPPDPEELSRQLASAYDIPDPYRQ
jgi:hypothetical protein